MEAAVGRDDRGGAVFGDDGGPGVFMCGSEGLSFVEFREEFLAVEQDRDVVVRDRAELCPA